MRFSDLGVRGGGRAGKGKVARNGGGEREKKRERIGERQGEG